MARNDLYVARRNTLVTYEGRKIRLTPNGPFVRDGHPLLEGREDLFRLVEVVYEARRKPGRPPKEEAPVIDETEVDVIE